MTNNVINVMMDSPKRCAIMQRLRNNQAAFKGKSDPFALQVYHDISFIHDDVRTILTTIGNSPFKPLVPEVLKLCSLYLVNSASTATCERNFSCVRRVKTYLRSIMTQVRLNCVHLLNVYKDDADKVDLLQIMQKFNDLRRKTFY